MRHREDLAQAIDHAVDVAFGASADRHARPVHQLSISALGACTRQGAYKLARVESSDDPGHGSRTAVLGTAIHAELVADIAAALGDDASAELPVTLTVRSGDREAQIPGRCDVYDPARRLLVDVKTCGDWAWRRAATGQVQPEHLTQVHGYAAALTQQHGRDAVRHIAIVYIHRATAAHCVVQWPATSADIASAVVRAATLLDHADNPDAAPAEHLPSRLTGAKWSPCDTCPWIRRCHGAQEPAAPDPTDPETLQALAQYVATAATAADAERRRSEMKKSFLDRLATGIYGRWRVAKHGKGNVVRPA